MGNKQKNRKTGSNKTIWFVTYLISAVFALLALYIVWFMQAKSEDVINNPYNGRLAQFSERVVRGDILSNDGRILAETVRAEDGSEIRSYPYGPLFCHAVGWSTKGKTGLESLADFYLLSSHVGVGEKIMREMMDEKNPGDHVVTTLDIEVQQAAYDALGDRRGAVVAMEPDTGKILAMVSKPDFDPNQIDALWDSLVNGSSEEGLLLNRAAQGLYPPGSTFKILTALEQIREHPNDYDEYQFDCTGVYQNGDYSIRCYHGNAHGLQNLTQAFANSCNGAFANLGLYLDHEKMAELAKQLLFNRELPLSLPYSKSSYTMGAAPETWEALQTSIGQGGTQITPIHNLMITAAIANGGVLMKPYLIDCVTTAKGEETERFCPEEYGRLLTETEAQALTAMMTAVVTEGTASALQTDAYQAAGKTGSAEFEQGKESHAWFTGFAPADDPQIAVTVLVEEGGSGGREAAPIAKAVMDAYFQ